MSKSYLSKEAFLAGILGTAVDFDVEGLGTIKIRPLTTVESNTLGKENRGDGIGMMLVSVRTCLVEPALTDSDLEALGKGMPGIITTIGEKILEISGLTEKVEELEKKVGSGS